MKKILLTSNSFANPKIESAFKELASEIQNKKVLIITTAAKEKENNRYAQLTYQQLTDWNFQPSFLDLEKDTGADLSAFDIFYVCGGNTFRLLKYAQKEKFGDSLQNLMNRGGLYVGVSAGSLIVGPSIQIANEIKPDINDVELKDFSGFNITNLIIFPHYSEEHENDLIQFEKKYNLNVTRIKNGEAILLKDEELIFISN